MKKLKTIIPMLLIMLFVVSGCSSTKSESSNGMLNYTDANNKVEYKANPKVVSDYFVGEMLQLDVNVVGANLAYKSPYWKTDKIEDVGDSIEKIATLKPDLIITINKDLVAKYQAVAPTIYLEYGVQNPEEVMTTFGQIFNKEDKAKAWIDQFNKKTDELKNQLPQATKDKTYSIMKLWDKDIWLYGNNWGHGGYIIYDKLGLKAPQAVQKEIIDAKKGYINISTENLNKFSGDVIIAMDFLDNNAILQSKIYKNLPAVKNNQVYKFNSNDFFHTDPISLDNQLEKFKGMLLNEK